MIKRLRLNLFRARAEQHHGDGAQENREVEPDGPGVNVLEIQADPVPKIGDFVAAADLPETGEAGLDAQAAAVREVVEAFDLVHGERARAYEAHFAAQDVEQLRQLVEAELAENLAERRDARVVGDLENGAGHFIHRGQFVLELLGVGRSEEHTSELQSPMY